MSARKAFPGQLRCDDCQLLTDVADLFQHIDDKCDKCGGDYLNDADRVVLAALGNLADSGLIEPGSNPDAFLSVRLDTAGLHK